MVGLPRLRWPELSFWPNHVRPFDYLDILEERRRAVYELIDGEGFGSWIVFVAGVGFLTDAYDIFAVNMILPMLSIVFWNGNIPLSVTTAFNSATLLGTVVGQVTFGVLADRYGRKKMYGLELLIVIFATLGLALSSRGEANSIHIIGWLVFWRLLMGFGIGGDYPLSAVITAEFAPRNRRARMLAAVFFMQPIGQLIANVVAVIATAAYHRYIFQAADPLNCVGECLQTTDKIWRWVVGLGAIPPAIAVLFRLYIPESPRYTLEVEMDSDTAVHDSEWYYRSRSSVAIQRNVEEPVEEPAAETAQVIEMRPSTRSLPQSILQQQDGGAVGHGAHLTVPPEPLDHASSSTQAGSGDTKNDAAFAESLPSPQHRPASAHSSHSASSTIEPPPSPLRRISSVQSANSVLSAISGIAPDPSAGATNNPPAERPRARKPTWGEYRSGFKKYFFTDGNWTDLAGTASTWLLLDFSFYFLGVNSSHIIANIWGTSDTASVYEVLMQNGWRALITNTIGALVGGAIVIGMVRWRVNVQMYGFLILAALFFTVGWTFVYLLHTRFLGAIIVLYVLCQLFFNLGPNSTTFIIPAEVFPTQYRATCHGISAAAGKVGSILAQIFLAYAKFNHKGVTDQHSTWLGWVLVVFTLFMISGAVITYFWVPNPCDLWGSSRSLEVLALGKAHRLQLEADERQAAANGT